MASSSSYQVTTGGGKSHFPLARALHSKTFLADPVINFLIHTMDPAKRAEYLPQYIGTLIKAGAINGGIFDEAWTDSSPAPASVDDPKAFEAAVVAAGETPTYAAAPACSAIWLPPGRKIDDYRNFIEAGFVGMLMKIGLGGCKRMLIDFQSKSNAAKKKGLGRPGGKGLVDFWYLFFISTKEEERGRGLSSALIRRFQEKVQSEGLGRPIWLESTTEKSRRVYEKCGFSIVDSWVLGKGSVNKDGLAAKGGEGVTTWAMIWKPNEQ